MAVETCKLPLLGKTTHPPFFSAQVRKKLSWDSCLATKSFKLGKLAVSKSSPAPHFLAGRLFGRPMRLVVVNGGDKD